MTETIADRIYSDIKKDINNLVLNADEFLVEQEIAKRYGVSKAPVREAVHRLCQEGQLISYPRKGYFIVTISEKEFGQIQELRWINESKALDILAEKGTQADFDRLQAILGQHYDINSNSDFHITLARLTGNRYLEDIVSRLVGTISRSLSMLNRCVDASEIKCYHREIVQALQNRDAVRAKEFLRKDMNLLDVSYPY